MGEFPKFNEIRLSKREQNKQEAVRTAYRFFKDAAAVPPFSPILFSARIAMSCRATGIDYPEELGATLTSDKKTVNRFLRSAIVGAKATGEEIPQEEEVRESIFRVFEIAGMLLELDDIDLRYISGGMVERLRLRGQLSQESLQDAAFDLLEQRRREREEAEQKSSPTTDSEVE